jgi:type II secretory pathway component PulM
VLSLRTRDRNFTNNTYPLFTSPAQAAGTRARKHLQELKTLAQELRVQIQETKNEKTAPTSSGAVEDSGVVGGQYEEGDHEQVGF